MSSDTSPQITQLDWGRTEVAEHGAFKDAKLWPGGARAWDWNETGTDHTPGIQPADVRELLDNGAQIVILSQGQQKRLQVQPQTLDMLRERGVEAHVMETRQAVEQYNTLAADGEPVGALIHSTC